MNKTRFLFALTIIIFTGACRKSDPGTQVAQSQAELVFQKILLSDLL